MLQLVMPFLCAVLGISYLYTVTLGRIILQHAHHSWPLWISIGAAVACAFIVYVRWINNQSTGAISVFLSMLTGASAGTIWFVLETEADGRSLVKTSSDMPFAVLVTGWWLVVPIATFVARVLFVALTKLSQR